MRVGTMPHAGSKITHPAPECIRSARAVKSAAPPNPAAAGCVTPPPRRTSEHGLRSRGNFDNDWRAAILIFPEAALPLITLHDILERARAAGQKLAAGETLWVFAAVTRLAAGQKATVRSRLVQLDPSGSIQLARFDEKRADDEPGYLAPELLDRGAPAKTEPRVQVYAAGALGYELLTGQPAPDPRKGPGAELTGPFGDLVRIAMARDRRERFGDLQQLREAVDGLQRPAGAESERQAFAALVLRSEKWGGMPEMDRAALAKLIEHVSHLGRQMDAVRSGMADVQRDQQDLNTRMGIVESRGPGQSVVVRSGSGFAPGLLGGIFGAALAAAALFAAGLLNPSALRGLLAHRAAGAAPSDPRPATAVASVVPAPAPTPVPTPAPAPIAAPAPAPTPPASLTRPSRAELARAVAEAQVKRGDAELERGRYDAAAEEFQGALTNDAALAVAWRGLGIAHLMRHDEESARRAYEKYLQLAPSAPDARDIRKAIAELNARAKIGAGAEK
jgi:tetratricopeptide (TPR) repeat protein